MPYITIRWKFIFTLLISTAWMLLSIWLSVPWYEQLSANTTPAVAAFLIGFIAIIPGFMNAFIMVALAFDKRPAVPMHAHYPSVTVLVAAYNEAASIEDTVRSLMRQTYPGELQVTVINDGSADDTATIVRSLLPEFYNLSLIDLTKNGGKANALNQGLAACTSEFVITVDADCWIWKHGIQNLVGRRLADPPNTRAVAGAILIRNSRDNWLTKAQEWDYFLGIAAIKRIQSLFQGTLVAQGAFSLYDRTTLVEVGGWPHTVGEDIVLTWKILRAGYRVGHAENAIALTRCPDNLTQFIRQRQRWSRGLIEAFKMTPDILMQRRMPIFYIWWNTLFPFMDLAYTLGFIPGLVLAMFGYFWIVGPMTLALLPISFLMNSLMYSRSKATFDEVGLKVRRNRMGLLSYALVYSIILQPACVWGYISEILNLRKTWGTK
jgi:biofilm PGA synthesis N-glycosyltransferase PgaC